MQVTQQMLEAAMKKAVQLGALPTVVDGDSHLKDRKNMLAILQAALDAPTGKDVRLAAVHEDNEALVAKLLQQRDKKS